MQNKGILIIYGSLNSVPSPEGAAPAKVIFETVESLKDMRFRVLSNHNPKLNNVDYDRSKYLHVSPSIVDKLGLLILKVLYPFKKRKAKFSTTSDSSLIFFITVCRFLLFNRYKKIIVHVSVGMVAMIKLIFPKRDVVFYHHGTSLHSKYNEKQWTQLTKDVVAIFGVNKVALEKANAKFITKLESSRYFPIPNAIIPIVNLEQSKVFYKNRNYDSDTFVFAFSGRICAEKGVMNLLKAFERVYYKNNRVRLLIFGAAGTRETHDVKTEYLKKCVNFVKSNAIPIVFAGFLSDHALFKAISEVDVIILPTDNKLSEEGMPLSLIEGLSLGKPIIATNSGGNIEIVKEDHNGILIKTNPYIKELSEAMLRLSLDKEFYRKLSNGAYLSYVKYHSYASYVKKFKKTLENINFK